MKAMRPSTTSELAVVAQVGALELPLQRLRAAASGATRCRCPPAARPTPGSRGCRATRGGRRAAAPSRPARRRRPAPRRTGRSRRPRPRCRTPPARRPRPRRPPRSSPRSRRRSPGISSTWLPGQGGQRAEVAVERGDRARGTAAPARRDAGWRARSVAPTIASLRRPAARAACRPTLVRPKNRKTTNPTSGTTRIRISQAMPGGRLAVSGDHAERGDADAEVRQPHDRRQHRAEDQQATEGRPHRT